MGGSYLWGSGGSYLWGGGGSFLWEGGGVIYEGVEGGGVYNFLYFGYL